MENALVPYMTAGIAVLGAGAIAVTPIAPALPDIQIPSVQLTGTISDLLDDIGIGGFSSALDVYPNLIGTAFDNVTDIGAEWLAHPFPILGAVLSNQVETLLGIAGHPSEIFAVPAGMVENLGHVVGRLGGFVGGTGFQDMMLGPLASAWESLGLGGGIAPTSLADVVALPSTFLNAFLNGGDHGWPGLLTSATSAMGAPGVIDGLLNFVPQNVAEALSGGGLPGLDDVFSGLSGLPDALANGTLGSLDFSSFVAGLQAVPGHLLDGIQHLGTNIGDLLGNLPLVGDAFNWLIAAIMAVF